MITSIGIFVVLLLSPCILVNGEFYSSADNMLELEHAEQELVIATREFLKEQQKQLNEYRSFVARVRLEHETARQLGGEFWEHPVNYFRLVKRLDVEWDNLHDLMEENPAKTTFKMVLGIIEKEVGLPNQTDLRGISRSIVRLQSIYNITANEFADGFLHGYDTETMFIWRDCFELGVQLYEQQYYKWAAEWLEVARHLLQEVNRKHVDHYTSEIKEYLALTYIELGEKDKALELFSDALRSKSSQPLQQTLLYLEQRPAKSPKQVEEQPWADDYRQLCQGKYLPQQGPSRGPLFCYLDSERDAVFRLAPLKVEQLHYNPDINVYHQVLTDDQIDAIYNVSDAFEKIRSAVAGSKVTDIRVSQQNWINYTSPIMAFVSKRVQAITGLDTSNTEDMQVADYGIGGQYSPHYDFMNSLRGSFVEKGNRLATVMFYFSDVQQGGYTVYPDLNVIAKPVKGSMVVWHNQLRSLEKDTLTLHAGCPVIEGFKRIGNIWIHSVKQEFRRPCSLNPDE